MADNYLEKRREQYEKRKKLWLTNKLYKKGNKGLKYTHHLDKPEDESL